MKWFTSDLHFFHKNICSFTNRPWKQEDNEEALIELWNSQVSAGDEVWNLGDFLFLNNNAEGIEKGFEVVNRLNGNIRMILGNHDKEDLFRKLQKDCPSLVSLDRLKEIKCVLRDNLGIIGKQKLVMCHYPMLTFNQSHRGAIMIHGHEHGRIHAPGRVIDVGLDGSLERLGEWRFWTEEDIIQVASEKEPYNPSRREAQ